MKEKEYRLKLHGMEIYKYQSFITQTCNITNLLSIVDQEIPKP